MALRAGKYAFGRSKAGSRLTNWRAYYNGFASDSLSCESFIRDPWKGDLNCGSAKIPRHRSEICAQVSCLLTMLGMDPVAKKPDAASAKPPFRIGNVTLPSRYLLAPLAGYTNIALRLALREVGGLGLATSDLVNARALLQRSRRTLELVQTTPEDRPLSIQIYGKEPGDLQAAAQWLQDYGVTTIDINMGCPVHKVTKGGGGAALMCEPEKAVALVQAVVKAVSIPVTVKMRLGWDDQTFSALISHALSKMSALLRLPFTAGHASRRSRARLIERASGRSSKR